MAGGRPGAVRPEIEDEGSGEGRSVVPVNAQERAEKGHAAQIEGEPGGAVRDDHGIGADRVGG